MKLEAEIQQKKFKNEFHKAIVNILFTGSWMNGIHKHFFKQYEITPQQYNVLRILRGCNPHPASVNIITERMLDKMSNVSRLIDKLKQKELLKRKACRNDRRQVDVVITQKGLRLLSDIDEVYCEVENRLQNITEEEAVELNRILDKLRG